MAGRRVIELSRNLASQTVLEQPLADFEALLAGLRWAGATRDYELSWTIPRARSPIPIAAVSGPTIAGQ